MNHDGAYALHWRCGGASVFRSVEISHAPHQARGKPVPRQHPLVVISGHGGGNWYNFREGGDYPEAPGYRHLLVDGARGPLNFYQLSPQHVSSDAAIEFRDAQDVSVFGTKYEGNMLMARISAGSRIRFFGHGGNGKPVAGGSLFAFRDCRDFLVANAVEGPTKIGEVSLSHRLGGTDPKLWSMLVEETADGKTIRTDPLDRPVLYRRNP